MGFTIIIPVAIAIMGLATIVTPKPIMVSFGTNPGPIVPRAKYTAPSARAAIVARSPAPVSESLNDDVPNPTPYRPPIPHQYRTRLYAVPPSPNLVLGTPLDQRFTPAIDKSGGFYYSGQTATGRDFTGPNVFARQEYEVLEEKRMKTTLQPSVRYIKPHYYQQKLMLTNGGASGGKFVPQIGIVYSSGVRYYVPQFGFDDNQGRQSIVQPEDEENSVYDRNDYYNYRQ